MDSFWGILQSLHHFLTLLSNEKCYFSQGIFEFLFHIYGSHRVNTTGRNHVMESTLHVEDAPLDFPLGLNSDVHTTISSKYMDMPFYLERQIEQTTNRRNTLISALQRAVGISWWDQVVLLWGACHLLSPRMFYLDSCACLTFLHYMKNSWRAGTMSLS